MTDLKMAHAGLQTPEFNAKIEQLGEAYEEAKDWVVSLTPFNSVAGSRMFELLQTMRDIAATALQAQASLTNIVEYGNPARK